MSHVDFFIVYRMLIVLGGILCIYLGYRLFHVVQTTQGELKAKHGEKFELTLKDMAPGTYFAVCGTAILAFSLLHKMDINIEQQQPIATNTQPQMPLQNWMEFDEKGFPQFYYRQYLKPPGIQVMPETDRKIHIIGGRVCESIMQPGCMKYSPEGG
ncbi:hypothetical protein [Pseudomonas monteilii]|uniref:hypothetical protein n=1 Tax=Pseudomonas monteilii TaxID=76759 RepID=UPI0008636739|nr:hypothetical protein [Pseudomonas monteilii]